MVRIAIPARTAAIGSAASWRCRVVRSDSPVRENATNRTARPPSSTAPTPSGACDGSWRSRIAAAVAVLAVLAPDALVAHAGPAGPGGVIKGTVVFDGAPPERPKIRRDSDPYCARTEQLADDVVVTDGKLKDVLVRIKNGSLPAARPAAAAPALPAVVIDQKDCRYAPRVIGLVVGQKLAVRNSDATFHNVHGSIAGKLIWNKPSGQGDPELSLDGSPRAGDVLEIVCDVHPWMRAYAVVQDHAAFAVTGEDGAFELRGLAPGSYTVEAWHPVLGTRSTTVKIGRGAAAVATAKLTFRRE